MKPFAPARAAGMAALCVLALSVASVTIGPLGFSGAGAAPHEGSAVRGGGRAAPSHKAPERVARVKRVIDGDTFVLQDGARVRVRNYDTPERRRYRCADEKRAAEAATQAARALLGRHPVALAVSGEDRYGRLVADVAILRPGRREDYVARMLAAGHGARWDYGREARPTWCKGRRWWDAVLF